MTEARAKVTAYFGGLAFLLIGAVGGYWLGGLWLASIGVVSVLLGIIVTSRWFWPHWWGQMRVQLLALTVFGLAVEGSLMPSMYIVAALEWLFGKSGVQINIGETVGASERVIFIGVVGAFLTLLTFGWERRRLIAPAKEEGPKEDVPFPEEGYEVLRDRFCRFFVSELDRCDRDLDWSDSGYIKLEAEVDMERQGGRRPKVAKDLIAAVRRDHNTRAFLLIGDPGSGKSVSLRRFCRVLYGKVSESGIVPVYINLREWDGPKEPTDEDIYAFMLRYLKILSGREGRTFLEKFYEPMLKHGRFFFILDSFDEMPIVLDCEENSPRLKKISEAFDRFFHDMHMCRGVLASRPFRRPVGFRGRKFTIRPFKETQVRRAMKTWLLGTGLDTKTIITKLFKEHPELVPAVRNPFSADLVGQYIANHNGEIPSSSYQIFQDYIDNRIREDVNYIEGKQSDPAEILEAAADIAWRMYKSSDVGLEAEVSWLCEQIGDPSLLTKIEIMRDCRIVRSGGVRRHRLSFVHRRFAEFFVVTAFLENKADIELNAIPEDSRWRDCLVVYSGIAPSSEAKKIADYCWSVFRDNSDLLREGKISESRSVVHCLRFLRDAFQGRPECIESFLDELSELVVKIIQKDRIFAAKEAAQMLGLLTPAARSKGVIFAFRRGIPWISECALRACRHLASLEEDAVKAIGSYVRKLPTSNFLGSFRDLNFSLSLSESLRRERHLLFIGAASIVLMWSTFVIMAAVIPAVIAMALLFATLLYTSWLDLKISQRRPFFLAMPFVMPFVLLERVGRPGSDVIMRMTLLFSVFILGLLPISARYLGLEYRIPVGRIQSFCIWMAFACLLPWDEVIRKWDYLTKLIGKPRELLLLIGKGVAGVALMAAGGGIVSGCVVGVYYLIKYISEWLLKIIVIVISSVIVLGFAVICWFVMVAVIKKIGCAAQDRRRLSRIQIPEMVSREWVHKTLRDLQLSSSRTRLLEILRVTNTKAVGEEIPLPQERWVDVRVREQYARLEEQWNGLAE